MQDTSPSTEKQSFCCPYCGSHSHQYWYLVNAIQMRDNTLPFDARRAHQFINFDAVGRMIRVVRGNDLPISPEEITTTSTELRKWYDTILGRQLFLHRNRYPHDALVIGTAYHTDILNLSRCYSCKRIAVWVYGKLVYPPLQHSDAPLANPDLPEDIKRDYEEAANILELSPRGAAALLRLAVEKLCKILEPTGKNLGYKIGNLVQQGLPVEIQQALDVLRVTGNHAVHPGQMDFNDNKDIALSLFHFLNLIVERMISQKKHIEQAYQTLPEKDLKGIENRDNKGE